MSEIGFPTTVQVVFPFIHFTTNVNGIHKFAIPFEISTVLTFLPIKYAVRYTAIKKIEEKYEINFEFLFLLLLGLCSVQCTSIPSTLHSLTAFCLICSNCKSKKRFIILTKDADPIPRQTLKWIHGDL